jgi:dipeptidyl aminopeptidase/acylaminoacyl peptidase
VVSFLGLALPINDRSNEKLFAASSPISHVSRQAPAVLLIHGDVDRTVPYQQSVAMEAALRAVNVPVTLLRIPGGDHGPALGLLVNRTQNGRTTWGRRCNGWIGT